MTGRGIPFIVAIISLAPAGGCGGLGVYRAAGHLPSIAATDYAFYNYCATSSQLFPFSPLQVETASLEALGDLGFKVVEPPAHDPDGQALIHCQTPDGRPTEITITPQNSNTNVRVKIGPIHIGDQELSRDLLRRIALNFGTVMRAYTPFETTLSRRINLSRGIPPRIQNAPPPPLVGDGLRPDENRDRPAGTDASSLGSESVPIPNLPGPFSQSQGFVPTRNNPNPPNMPFSPFPYTPFNNN